jgi:MerR family transcriptional regulator, light-induced transcriptional regulator
VLWQTNSICPAHEHFISNIIRQKLLVAVDALPLTSAPGKQLHILYLPENELHELGLLYVNYLLRQKGERTIYLGQSVPLADLQQVTAIFPGDLNFISILTTSPRQGELPDMLTSFRTLFPEERVTCWLAGNQLAATPDNPRIRLFGSMKELLSAVEEV